MPDCRNCGAHVTEAYVRVFARRGQDGVFCCPDCEDVVRRNGGVKTARSSRDGGRDPRRRPE